MLNYLFVNIKHNDRQDNTVRILQSLSRGLKALDLLRAADEPVKLTELAETLGVDKSNASHLLKTLVAAGYAEQNESRRYLATDRPAQNCPPVHSLEDVVAYKEICRPVLEKLVAETRECAHLAVLVGDRVWYVDKVDSTLPLKVDHQVGSLSPLHCTALGKAFLAFGDAALPEELARYTDSTITDPRELEREIALTRARGYAIDDEEFSHGIRCAARPVYNDRGVMIAALGLSGPSVRIDDARLEEIGALVRATVVQPKKEEAMP